MGEEELELLESGMRTTTMVPTEKHSSTTGKRKIERDRRPVGKDLVTFQGL
jgi:hypothetical protein